MPFTDIGQAPQIRIDDDGRIINVEEVNQYLLQDFYLTYGDKQSGGALDSDNINVYIVITNGDLTISGLWTFATHPLGLDHTQIAGIGTKTHAELDTEVTANTTHRSSSGTNHSSVVLNNAHRVSSGASHSDVVLNSAHRVSQADPHGLTDNILVHEGSVLTHENDILYFV